MVRLPQITISDARGAVIVEATSQSFDHPLRLAITGPSGSGKSIYLHALFGLNSGQRSRDAPFQPRQGQCLVVQDPSAGLTPGLTIEKHLRDIALSDPKRRHKFIRYLKELGLPSDILKRKPQACSGGEKQRLMVALVRAADPALIACDEPTASLDSENEIKLMDLLMKDQTATDFLFVTHRLDTIKRYASHVMVFEDQRNRFVGSVDQFFAGSQTRFQQRISKTEQASWSKSHETPSDRCVLDFEVTLLRGYDGGLGANLAAGDWHWVAGPSGSGKTTLLATLAGLLEPSEGTVHLNGAPLAARLQGRSLSQKKALHLVWQHPMRSWNPCVTVAKQLSWTPQVDSLRSIFDLQSLDLNRYPSTFSMGEMQRLSLLQAFASSAQVLLLDESFSSMDDPMRFDLIPELRNHPQCTHKCVIATTHDRSLIDRFSAPVLSLDRNIQSRITAHQVD